MLRNECSSSDRPRIRKAHSREPAVRGALTPHWAFNSPRMMRRNVSSNLILESWRLSVEVLPKRCVDQRLIAGCATRLLRHFRSKRGQTESLSKIDLSQRRINDLRNIFGKKCSVTY